MNKTDFRALPVETMRETLLEIFEDNDGALLEMTKAELTDFGIEHWDEIDWEVDEDEVDEAEEEPEADESEDADPGEEDDEDSDDSPSDDEEELSEEDDEPEQEEGHPVRNLDLGYGAPRKDLSPPPSRDLG